MSSLEQKGNSWKRDQYWVVDGRQEAYLVSRLRNNLWSWERNWSCWKNWKSW